VAVLYHPHPQALRLLVRLPSFAPLLSFAIVNHLGEDNCMRIDSKALVASISSLTDAQPQHDLAATLQQVVDAAKLLFGAKGAGVMLADEQGQLRWVSATDQDSQLAEDNQELLGQGPCQVAFSQRPGDDA
jgi:hypothetical protein